MTVPSKYRGQLCGLCGDFNGDKSDDFFSGKSPKSPQNRQIEDGQHFGDSWRVGGLRACSVLPKDMPHSYEPECTQNWSNRIKSDKYCNALKSSLFEKCADKVDPDYYFKACKLDMCECPGEQCHCEVLTAYARECERAGQLIYDWRGSTGCKNVTSFKYAEKHQNEVIQHQKFTLPKMTTTKTTTTTTQTTTTTELITTTTEIPDWILGPYLPACSPETAAFCENRGSKNRKNRHNRRRLRNKEKRRRKRKERARRRKARRKRKRMMQQRRKQLMKHKRRRKHKQNHVFRMGDIALTMQRENRKIEWSSLLGGKRPPFETLLSHVSDSDKIEAEMSTEPLIEEEFEELAPSNFDEISSSDFQQKRPNFGKNGQKRKPLPLKEAFEEPGSHKENQRGWKRRKRK